MEVKAYHGNTSAIANDPNVDLVVVSIHISQHKAAIQPIVDAKKDLFIEWPVGASVQDTKDILDIVKKGGTRAVVGLQAKYSPVFKKVCSIIRFSRCVLFYSLTRSKKSLPLERLEKSSRRTWYARVLHNPHLF